MLPSRGRVRWRYIFHAVDAFIPFLPAPVSPLRHRPWPLATLLWRPGLLLVAVSLLPVAGASATREPSKAFVIMSLTAVGRRSYFSSRTLGRITEILCLYHFFSVHFGFRLRFFAFGNLPPSLWRLRAFQSVPKRNSYPDGKTRKPSSMVQSSTHARQPDTLSAVPLQCLTELWAYPLVGSGDPHRWVSVLSHFLLRPASLGLALCSSSTQQRSRGLGEERRRSPTHHPAWPPVFNTLTSSRTFAETFTTCDLLALDTG